uniref:Zinc finger C2HC domain-containing protein 1A n=1 Tax=Scleropages formosus TaxID=113540 RepID=A0A8C9SNW7_SCLFO
MNSLDSLNCFYCFASHVHLVLGVARIALSHDPMHLSFCWILIPTTGLLPNSTCCPNCSARAAPRSRTPRSAGSSQWDARMLARAGSCWLVRADARARARARRIGGPDGPASCYSSARRRLTTRQRWRTSRPEPPKKQSNWRRKHEEFIATIRAAKGLSQVMKDGGPLPPPPPPSFDPDYIQCPYCQRRFNENAAERHIKFCKEQAARIPNKGKVAGDTKGKPPARTQYKPPPVKKTNSPAVSVVSSASRLPQRSTLGQPTGGTQASKPPPAGSVKSASSGYSLPRTNPSGLTSPPSGLKPRTPTSPGSLKNTYSAAGMNKRKVSNADSNISRNDSKNAVEVDHPTGQQTKFCHECGTKFPVESAKFC